MGKDLKDAEENFMRIDIMKCNGFTLDDLPIRLEYDKEKCKNWSMDTYCENNENPIKSYTQIVKNCFSSI